MVRMTSPGLSEPSRVVGATAGSSVSWGMGPGLRMTLLQVGHEVGEEAAQGAHLLGAEAGHQVGVEPGGDGGQADGGQAGPARNARLVRLLPGPSDGPEGRNPPMPLDGPLRSVTGRSPEVLLTR